MPKSKSTQLRKYEKIYEQCVRSAMKKSQSKPKKSTKSKRRTSAIRSKPKRSSRPKRRTSKTYSKRRTSAVRSKPKKSRKLSRYNIFVKSYFKTHKNKSLSDAAKAWNKQK